MVSKIVCVSLEQRQRLCAVRDKGDSTDALVFIFLFVVAILGVFDHFFTHLVCLQGANSWPLKEGLRVPCGFEVNGPKWT